MKFERSTGVELEIIFLVVFSEVMLALHLLPCPLSHQKRLLSSIRNCCNDPIIAKKKTGLLLQ